MSAGFVQTTACFALKWNNMPYSCVPIGLFLHEWFLFRKWIKLVVTCLSVHWFLPNATSSWKHPQRGQHTLTSCKQHGIWCLGGHLLEKLHKTKALIWTSLHILVYPTESKLFQKKGTLMYNNRHVRLLNACSVQMGDVSAGQPLTNLCWIIPGVFINTPKLTHRFS